ncbi:MAG: histidine kinase [Oscillospiraceae bacterium]
MKNLANKIVLCVILAINAANFVSPNAFVVTLLFSLAISAFLEYFSSMKFCTGIILLYTAACTIFPQFIFFAPLIFFDVIFSKLQVLQLLIIIPMVMNSSYLTTKNSVYIFLFFLLSYVLKYQQNTYSKLYNLHIREHDELTITTQKLAEKVTELTDHQGEEIVLAKLNERNRIAREIHDNVGHLLSCSILQIGAIMAVTKEDFTKESLLLVKNTLDTGMNSIRDSVHDLHEVSIDLYAKLHEIVRNFQFCKAELTYEISRQLDVKFKYALISIVKEALANVIKHSNATEVAVKLYEHPKIIQLIIWDNGTKISKNSQNGMGLESIKQRAEAFDGIVNFNSEVGFKIFISFRI